MQEMNTLRAQMTNSAMPIESTESSDGVWAWSMPVQQVRDILRAAAQLVTSNAPSFTSAREFRIRWKRLLNVFKLELRDNPRFRENAEVRNDPKQGKVRRFNLCQLEAWMLESFSMVTQMIIDDFCVWYKQYDTNIGKFNAA